MAKEEDYKKMTAEEKEAAKEQYKKKYKEENPDGSGFSVNVGGYGNLIFKDDSSYDQFKKDPQSMTYSQGPGGRKYVEPKEANYAKGGIIINKGVGASMKPHNVFASKGKK
jgi:hypothetical protein